LQSIRSKAAAGAEDLPYLDFNHDDREASARVLSIRWGGAEPATGGVRAAVEWTGPGRTALEGKAYRRFSPSFYLDAEGRVAGAPLNMGGLVNRAAFKTITPIVAKSGDANPKTRMDETKMAAELAAANATIATLTAKLASADQAATIAAKDAEIKTLTGKVAALEGQITEARAASAKAQVDAAIKAGKIAPQATELHAKWVETLTANPSLAATLEAMPATIVVPIQVVPSVAGAGAPAGLAAKDSAEAFVQAVADEVKAGKSKGQAIDLVVAKEPKAYAAWREADGKPGI
jgi:hypothetical protein